MYWARSTRHRRHSGLSQANVYYTVRYFVRMIDGLFMYIECIHTLAICIIKFRVLVVTFIIAVRRRRVLSVFS